MWRFVFALVLVVSCPAGVSFAEGPESPASAAQRVLQIAEDGEALAALALRTNPDPWLVADAVDALGQRELALRFARAAAGPELEGLAEFVHASPAAAALGPLRERVRQHQEELSKGTPQALASVAALDLPPPTSIPALRLRALRASALSALGQLAQARAAWLAGATDAERSGWLALASEALYQAGLQSWYRQDYEQTLEPFEERLRLETRLASPAGQGRAHFGLAQVFDAMGDRPADVALQLEKAAELLQQAGDVEYQSKLLATRGARLALQGRLEEALASSREAATAFTAVAAGKLPARFRADPERLRQARIQALLNCAAIAFRLEREAEAVPWVQQAQRLAQASKSPWHDTLVAAQGAVIESTRVLRAGRPLAAIAELERARPLLQQLGRRVDVADVLRRIGVISLGVGDLGAALRVLRECVALLRETAARPALASALMDLGVALVRAGLLTEAAVPLEEALELARAAGPTGLVARILGAAAQLHVAQGHVAQALEAYQQAIVAERHRGAAARPGPWLVSLGFLRLRMEQSDEAIAVVKEGIALLEASGDARSLRMAHTEMGHLEHALGRHQEAYGHFASALAIARQQGDPLAGAAVRRAIGDVRFDQGAFALAVEDYAASRDELDGRGLGIQAVEVRTLLGRARFFAGSKAQGLREIAAAHAEAETLGDPSLIAFTARSMAEASLRARDYEAVTRWTTRALDVTAEHGFALAEGDASIARERYAELYEYGKTAAYELRDWRLLYDFLERARASELLASLGGRDSLREASVPSQLREAEDAARDSVARASAAYLEVQARRGSYKESRRRKLELDEAHRALREAVSTVQAKVRMQADLAYHQREGFEAVQSTLGVDEALVIYDGVQGHASVAFVLTRGGVRVQLLKSRQSEVSAAVEALLADSDQKVVAEAAPKLREMLIQPLDLPATIHRVLVAPGPRLAYVPFPMLDLSREYVHVPSATVYGVLRKMDSARGQAVLALGDPDYAVLPGVAGTGAARVRGGGRKGLHALPESGKEVRAIASGKRDVRLLGQAATETAFRNEAGRRRWRAIHVACHGRVDCEHPTLCSLEMTADEKNDGSLWAMDVFRIPVDADLVVLSACQTGRGRVVAGEGVIGLARAFMQAGAPRVIASLWDVDDEATQELMKEFYRLWNPEDASQGKPAATALRLAQEHVRKQEKWKHPRYWAAWMLWGLPD